MIFNDDFDVFCLLIFFVLNSLVFCSTGWLMKGRTIEFQMIMDIRDIIMMIIDG